MKKLALMNLIVLIAIKSVSACEYFNYGNDPNYVDPPTENAFYSKLYFFSLVFLIIANLFLFFKRNQNDYLVLAIIIISIVIATPLTLGAALISGADCGDTLRELLKWDLIYFLLLTALQVGLWWCKRGLRLTRTKLS